MGGCHLEILELPPPHNNFFMIKISIETLQNYLHLIRSHKYTQHKLICAFLVPEDFFLSLIF